MYVCMYVCVCVCVCVCVVDLLPKALKYETFGSFLPLNSSYEVFLGIGLMRYIFRISFIVLIDSAHNDFRR